ncbi:hypothetical protein KUTeg_018388 [Tegillarca granosa]|uniref:Uncharacterized protein n=1 Tax=Tegillarca granosa TaxID=220873 RepID=A0ABQ9EI01_TEGGR|nr:hypothetical protein KUTeg_018388 [Tegillarca granosa]
MLQELEDQLDVLENKLMFYAEQIVSETRRIHGEEEDQSLPPTSPARNGEKEGRSPPPTSPARSEKEGRSVTPTSPARSKSNRNLQGEKEGRSLPPTSPVRNEKEGWSLPPTSPARNEKEGWSLPPTSPARTFITEVSQSDAVKSQSHRSSKGHRSMDFAETLMDAKKKSIEYCQFPGFRHGELIELPGQLESPPILHRVTKAQDFNSGFKRFWKKLFLSEASVAVMQDTFWWFFLNKYELKCQKDKDLLYDRIADSYVALFTSIHKDVKDKFLSEYPNCLSQAVYAAYFEAFPESRDKLEDSFKQELANVIHEWVTGLKPVPGTWKTWDVKRLEKPKGLERESEATKKLLQVQELNNKKMDSFSKIIDSLGKGDESHTAYTTSTRLSPTNVSREVTKMTTNTTLTSVTNGTFGSTVSNPLPGTISQISPSRLATRGTTFDKPLPESHQIGPGPDYERVMFNTQGRSPLISHYLHMRQLRDYHQPGKKCSSICISLTVDTPPGPTYRQLIQNTLSTSAALKKEYQKICEQTNTEIRELERKQRDTNREINRLTRELIFNKNPLDLKIP